MRKNWPYWLRGGIILAVIYPIFYYFIIFVAGLLEDAFFGGSADASSDNFVLDTINVILFFIIVFLTVPVVLASKLFDVNNSVTVVIIVVVVGFIVGSLIGLIIGKIKKKKQVPSQQNF